MIRLRDGKGKLLPLPEAARFIEVTDLQGRVALVTYLADDGSIRTFDTSDTREMQRYQKVMGVTACPVIKLPNTK